MPHLPSPFGLPWWISGERNPPANAGDTGSIPGSGRSSGEGYGYPLQYSCLGNPVDREAWWAIDHGGAKELDTPQELNNNPHDSSGLMGMTESLPPSSTLIHPSPPQKNMPRPLLLSLLIPASRRLISVWEGELSLHIFGEPTLSQVLK